MPTDRLRRSSTQKRTVEHRLPGATASISRISGWRSTSSSTSAAASVATSTTRVGPSVSSITPAYTLQDGEHPMVVGEEVRLEQVDPVAMGRQGGRRYQEAADTAPLKLVDHGDRQFGDGGRLLQADVPGGGHRPLLGERTENSPGEMVDLVDPGEVVELAFGDPRGRRHEPPIAGFIGQRIESCRHQPPVGRSQRADR